MTVSATVPPRASSFGQAVRFSVEDYHRYRNGHPEPRDVLLIIEVADSSLAYDRDVKLPRYARAGIPEAWLVDLDGRRLVRHRRPAGAAYIEVTETPDLTAVQLPVAVAGGTAPTLDLRALF